MSKKKGAEITINSDWCKKCGICIAFCPKQVYTTDREGAPIITNPEECIHCLMCEKRCPDLAISVDGGNKNDKKDS